MTETTPTEPVEPVEPVNPEPVEPVEPVEPEDGDQGKGSKREARYRRQLRDTEGERDTLQGRVESMQTAEAERLAADKLSKPGALWATGTELSALLDDDGNVDAAKVAEAAEAAALELGAAAPRRRPRPDSSQGNSGQGSPGSPWSEAFRGAR